MRVDLNSDVGESFGRYKIGMDERLIPLISSANAACGFHAADPVVMEKTVRLAADAGVQIGAHPGLPDLMGFGRRNLSLSAEEARAYTLYQLGALAAFLHPYGVKLQHVKPHGALYNMAAKDSALAESICAAIRDFDSGLIVLALSGGELYRAAKKLGLRTAAEVFADRAYEADGSLVSRRKEGALIQDEELAVRRVVCMVKEGKVKSIAGKDIPIRADSICVHGDGEKALLFVERIRRALSEEGIEIAPLKKIV